MKIAVTSTGPTLNDNVEARFGRCQYFLIIDTGTMQSEALENPNISLGGGAGIQSAQLMSEKEVTAVLTGNCGPNVFNVFGQAGIKVIVGVSGPVRNAVEQFKAGAFSSALGPNVASHFGMSTAPAEPTPMRHGMTKPMGLNSGSITDLGMGSGRGVGRCMGRGIARGRRTFIRTDLHKDYFPVLSPVASPSEPDVNREQAEAFLRGQAQVLEQQKDEVEQRIRELEAGQNLVAVVLPEKCAGCGICVDVCSVNAIEVNERALINAEVCVGCGACISECPNEAIILTQDKNH